VRVLDLGLAVAGPFGTQVLGDLGAEVIKVNTLYDMYWHANHIAFACNRGKRSIAINLKDPRGMEVLRQLVESADVVAHNMRYEAAVRLGVDEASLRAIKPDLIYCHSRGHDQARREMAGNDQTGSALAGVSYEDGGCANGGEPLWSLTSMGDTGNGFFCAIGIIQALYHRDRTGEGQFVDTSILQACLLNASSTWLAADGTAADRPHLDAELYGLSALYRLYRAAEGTWLCLAALEERHVAALFAAVAPELAGDPRFATDEARRANDGALVDELAAVFARRDAESWVKELDAAGVPAEVSSADYALTIFDDPEMVERQWVTAYDQPLVGHLEQFGLLIDFSETPGVIAGPPLTVGQDTRAILGELGRPDEEIDRLCADKVVLDPATPVAP
jgi:crotonobetainyl-CoA:carnitine CoA-transferase CaiB-like acyl-CoA transferase